MLRRQHLLNIKDQLTKKRYQNTENTIVLKDLTASDFDLQDAGSQLQSAIEDAMADTSYTLAGESARYRLKYKVLEFDGGSRIARIATMGFSDSAKAKLRVKAALFDGGDMVGAWEVDSWVKGVPWAALKKNYLNAQLKKLQVILRATSRLHCILLSSIRILRTTKPNKIKFGVWFHPIPIIGW